MSILFNGASYFQCTLTNPAMPLCQADKSISCRFYLTSTTGTQGFFNSVNLTTAIGYQLGIRSPNMTVWNYGGTIVVQYAPTLNKWIHVCYTYTAATNTSIIYEDGVQKATSTATIQTGSPDISQIGGNQWNENSVNAQMEDLRVYNRVLTLNEIITIANSDSRDVIADGLTAWWPMNEGRAGVTMAAIDFKEAYGRTSTLVGTAGFPISQDHRYLLKSPG